MRKLLLALAIVAVSAGAADALPSKPYVGIYADTAHSVTSLYIPPFTPFQCWIWWLPSEHGLIATEYRVGAPSNVIVLSAVANPDLMVLLGCPPPGEDYICAYFSSCMTDWVWTHSLNGMLMDPTPGFIEVLPPPGMSALAAANCSFSYPVEPVTILDKLGINQDGVDLGAESQPWGAIKSLYR